MKGWSRQVPTGEDALLGARYASVAGRAKAKAEREREGRVRSRSRAAAEETEERGAAALGCWQARMTKQRAKSTTSMITTSMMVCMAAVVMVGSWWWWWYLLRFCLVVGRESLIRELNCLISINAKCGAGGGGGSRLLGVA
jgi:hypothetical protein